MTTTIKMEKVAILGIGGGAGKIVDAIAEGYGSEWVSLAYLDTDVQDLEFRKGVLRVPLGGEWTQGMGCGGDTTLGENATSASMDNIREVIADADLVVVLACLGGGAGSGGVQALARLLRESKTLAFFFVTLPFAYEGNNRRAVAEKAANSLRGVAEVVVTVQNDLLFTHVPAHTAATEAFDLANSVLADGLVGIAELIRCRGLLAVDFASLRTLLRKRASVCSFGVGRAAGEDRVQAVIADLFESPLLGGKAFVEGAHVVVVTLVGGPDLSIGDVTQCLQGLQQQLNPSTQVITGANQDPALGDEITLTVLAVHYEGKEPTADQRRKAQDGTTKTRVTSGGARDKGDTTRQFKLPFEEERMSVGIFGNVTPTMHNGENLDIPTFQRRGVSIDVDAL